MQTNWFDEPVAARYDERSPEMFAPEVLGPTVDLLAELAGPGGSALELAVGTGRVALPLHERGVRVSGIELSAAMVERLRAKPGGDAIEVVLGDMTDAEVAPPGDGFDLCYLVFNTITNLTDQDAQVACFRNAAEHLRPGGHFVVETFVPILQRLPPGEVYRTFVRTADRHSFDEYDVVTQTLHSHHYRFHGDTYEVTAVPFRYAWPSELDLMARLAGMRLRDRWGDWSREPFTAASGSHVSVWTKG